MDLKEQLREVKTQLRLSMNGAVSASMREKGLVYKLNFGVELPRIRQIAESLPHDHRLADALWKEDIRECKILAALIQPAESFLPEIADIWAESIRHDEIAQLTSMNLFARLPYAPAKAMAWIARDEPFVRACGYLTIARLLLQKGDMPERAMNELIDQAVAAFIGGEHVVRTSVMAALRRFMHHSEANAFALCRRVEEYKDSPHEDARALYAFVAGELE